MKKNKENKNKGLELKYRIIDNHLCIAHFAINNELANKIYNKIKSFGGELKNIFLEEIELGLLDSKLIMNNVFPCSKKKISYLTKLEDNAPLIGIAKFAIMVEGINVSLPAIIPNEINASFKDLDLLAENRFNDFLIEEELCYYKDSDVITKNSSFTYDLIKRNPKNKEDFYKAEDQVYDLNIEDDYDPDMLIGKKIGDIIILDDSSYILEAEIKDITNTIPYTETKYNVNDISSFGFNTFKELKEVYISGFKLCERINKYIDFIFRFVGEKTNIDFPQSLKKFYKSMEPHTVNDLSSNDNINSRIKRGILFDMIAKMIESKSDFGELYSLKNINITDVLHSYCDVLKIMDFKDMMTKYFVLSYYARNKLIKGIDLKI